MAVPSRVKKETKLSKKYLRLLSVVLLILTGCVDINDPNVHVQQPGQVEQYQRSPLDKCQPHIYPHRLIKGQVALGSALLQMGSPISANDQPTFDLCWNYVSPQLDENKVPSFSLKPVVNWDQESAYFYVATLDNDCQKAEPYGDEMTTDCFNITILVYRTSDGKDCQPIASYPVFIYIYPKTTWPIGVQNIYPTATFTPAPTATATATPTPTPAPESDEG